MNVKALLIGIAGFAAVIGVSIPLTIHFVNKANYEAMLNDFEKAYQLYKDDVGDGNVDDENAYSHLLDEQVTGVSIRIEKVYSKDEISICRDVQDKTDIYTYSEGKWSLLESRVVSKSDSLGKTIKYIPQYNSGSSGSIQITPAPSYSYLVYSGYKILVRD